MNFNFDKLTVRRGTGSMKWDSDTDPDILPLWVADMDFRTAPAVTKAVVERAESGIFGYVSVPDSYYDALCSWFDKRHGWKIDRRRVIYTPGVVPAISAIIKALVRSGEGVILQTPTYNCFYSSVRNNKAQIVENPLRRIDTKTGFTYEMDFESLRELASKEENKLLILCNPQNPTGRVWRRDELETLRDICRDNGVMVVSDEIHCELVRFGGNYIPYATVDDQAVVCCSPSKAFNTAGLQIANTVCPDESIQSLIDRAVNDNEVCDVNPFGVAGLQAAYNEGSEWLGALNEYLDGNYEYLRDEFRSNLPVLKVCDSESTYLAWIDATGIGKTSDEIAAILRDKAKVHISSGSIYGGEGYIRINYACPRSRLAEALRRIIACLGKI